MLPALRRWEKKAKGLATADYENKMFACFKEMNRVLHPDGVLTVMFTHKQVQAWDTLGCIVNASRIPDRRIMAGSH